MAKRLMSGSWQNIGQSSCRPFSAITPKLNRFEHHTDIKLIKSHEYQCFIRPDYNVVTVSLHGADRREENSLTSPAPAISQVPNGGLTSSIALKASMAEVGSALVPVSATTHFHAMADSDAVGVVTASETSRSRAQAVVSTQLVQGGQLKADTCVVFADPTRLRGPQYFDKALQPPQLPPIGQCHTPRTMQPFVPLRDMYDVRLPQEAAQGGNLFELFTAAMQAASVGKGIDSIDPGLFSASACLEGYIAHSSGEPVQMHHLGFFADCLPPPMVQMECAVGNWVPTLQLSVYFRGTPLGAGAPHISQRGSPYAPAEDGNAAQWLRFRFVTRCITNGVCDIDGELWDETGSLVAQSRQLARLIPPPKR